MKLAVYDEHGAGLGRELCPWLLGKEALGGQHAGLLATDIKDAVRLEMEVAGSVCSVGSLERFPILDVKPNRRQVGLIHPGIHGECYRRPVQRGRQVIKAAIGLRMVILPEQSQRVGTKVECADNVIRSLERAWAAGRGAGYCLSVRGDRKPD